MSLLQPSGLPNLGSSHITTLPLPRSDSHPPGLQKLMESQPLDPNFRKEEQKERKGKPYAPKSPSASFTQIIADI